MTDSQKFDLILKKMSSIDGKIDTLNGKVDSLDGQMKTLRSDVSSLKSRVSSLEEDVKTLKADVSILKDKVFVLESDMKDVKLEMTGIHLTLENEIRVNIIRVAEGHFDLSRKLDENIKISNEIKDKQEITDIYIKMHDNKLRALA